MVKAPKTRTAVLAAKGLGLFCSMMCIGAGIVLFLKCRLGSDPQTVLYDGISAYFGISCSMAAGIYSWSVFAAAFLFARRYFGIGSVISALSLSFFMSFYERLLGGIDFAALSWRYRMVLMLAGQMVMCVGMTLSVWSDSGMGCSLAVLYKIRDVTGLRFRTLKTGNDILLAALGFLLGGIIGIGTVVSALATGIMISAIHRFLNRYLFIMPKLPDKMLRK